MSSKPIIYQIENLTKNYTFYSSIINLILGSISNILIILILSTTRTCRKNHCIFYLIVGSITDIGLIFAYLPFKIAGEIFGESPVNASTIWCKVQLTVCSILALCSLITTCFLAFDQYLSTNPRQQWKAMSTLRLAHRLTFFNVCFSISHNIVFIIFAENGKFGCAIYNPVVKTYFKVFFYPIFIIILPLTFIGLLGLLVYRNIQWHMRRRMIVMRRRLDRQMSVIVLARVLSIAILGSPFLCTTLYEINLNDNEENENKLAIYQLASAISYSLLYASYSMFSVGLDIGTTSCKICVVSCDAQHSVLFTEQLPHHAHIVQKEFPSYDEQSPVKILDIVNELFKKSTYLKDDSSIKSIQICGQMHGLILWSSKSPRTIVSSLVTWQDQRCSTEFLSSLGSMLTHLRTGYGLATLLWLMEQQKGKDDDLLKYDRAGTIADYVATIFCDDEVTDQSQISTQMATSWGAIDNQWPVKHRLLPEIVEPGTIIGYYKKKIPIYVALGDLQCSVFSCQPEKNEGIINISTSAQLALVTDKQSSNHDQLLSPMRVPYFQSKDLLVAASLNGGNVLSAFVHLVHSWNSSINSDSSSLSLDTLWSRLIQRGLESNSIIENISAALFGERHDPSMSASLTNIRSIHMSQLNDVGSVFRSICHWIIKNLFEMLGNDSSTINGIIGTGSALMRNGVLQREIQNRVQCQVKFNEHSDAAYGSALFAFMQ
ncbi:unnamed protein product [Adineta ricciae]|uniref:G-protein coupled receptors family 1 profile domain-containing protein n=1 Tax=Adineta ricciae TaxID=249248 RepID=A0A814A6F4_ADIRI|nr:unnamed protein product [Adineta ricciae]CAF1341473.1 unnamed protein product [Adineta ricciae]